MAFLWDTTWAGAATSTLLTIGDWPVADPLVEIENQGGLQNLDDLKTAMIIALFTDAKLPDGMIDQYNFTADDQHEWHGNTFGIEDDEEPLGSLLWTIERMPLTPDTVRLAEHYAAEALQPLVRQKRVSLFDISSEVDKANSRINLRIVAYPQALSFFADLWALR